MAKWWKSVRKSRRISGGKSCGKVSGVNGSGFEWLKSGGFPREMHVISTEIYTWKNGWCSLFWRGISTNPHSILL